MTAKEQLLNRLQKYAGKIPPANTRGIYSYRILKSLKGRNGKDASAATARKWTRKGESRPATARGMGMAEGGWKGSGRQQQGGKHVKVGKQLQWPKDWVRQKDDEREVGGNCKGMAQRRATDRLKQKKGWNDVGI